MNRSYRAISWMLIVLLASGAPAAAQDGTPVSTAPATSALLGLLPKPRELTVTGASFQVPTTLGIAARSPGERHVANLLVRFLQTRGITATTSATREANPAIRLELQTGIAKIGSEGYTLDVAADGIRIRANTAAGLFYGSQTLEQLFASDRNANGIPTVSVTDWPAYGWRGIHLDVSRHFFPVPVVERYIDVAAHYKLNTFHWHLTDDQGWRIAIRRYPKLTSIGSCRSGTEIGNDPATIDSKPYCGHYTQAQVRAVVRYAASRYITIVPEIEMPGHNIAALTAYPWLACARGRYAVRTTWGVSTDIACPTERTFAFEEHILDEIIGLFPGAYVHIGGDEVPKDAWQKSGYVHALMKREHLANYDAVQGYFTRRIEAYLSARGRKMIGWDEILDGGVSPHATVMSWRGTEGGIKAARRGNDVVMTPDGPMYLDWGQGDADYEPVSIGALSTPQMIYDFNPTPAALSPTQATHVLGVQANLWTERIATAQHLFYMLLPRELALAEDAWTPASDRVWSDFSARTQKQYAWFTAHDLNFRIPSPAMTISGGDVGLEAVNRSVNETELRATSSHGTITISDDVPNATIYFTTDDRTPTAGSTRYTQPVTYDLSPAPVFHLRAIAVLPTGRASAPTTMTIRL